MSSDFLFPEEHDADPNNAKKRQGKHGDKSKKQSHGHAWMIIYHQKSIWGWVNMINFGENAKQSTKKIRNRFHREGSELVLGNYTSGEY